MHEAGQPAGRSGVQLANAGRRVQHQFLEQRLLQLPERPLDLALSGRVPRPAASEREPVGGGELACWRVQHQPGMRAGHQRPHVVQAHHPGHPAGVLEEPHQPLQRVGTVHAGREPPEPVPAPTQDRPEALQRPKPPRLAPRGAVRPVDLRLLTWGGLDRHRHRARPTPADPPPGAQVPHQGRVAASKALGRQDPRHRGPKQIGVALQQLVDPHRPALVDHRGGHLPASRRAALLQPLADRFGMAADHRRDVGDRPALAAQRHHVHELLLRHHLPRPLQRSVLGRPTRLKGLLRFAGASGAQLNLELR